MTTTRRRRFYQTIQKQILVWPGEEPERIEYNGQPMYVPGRTEIAQDGKGFYRADSAIDAHGVFIPGTLVVSDQIRRTPEGGTDKHFDVALFCAYLERDRDDLWQRGLEVVTNVADVEEAASEALPRYEKSMDERARNIIVAELERRRRLEERGNPVQAGSSEHLVVWAFEHQKRRGYTSKPKVTTEDLQRVMLGEPPSGTEQKTDLDGGFVDIPGAPEFVTAPGEKPTAVSTDELTSQAPVLTAKPERERKYDPVKMRRTAKHLGLKLNKVELEALLDGDEETVLVIQEKIKLAQEEKAKKATEAAAPAPA